ncbi:MAG: adenylate kinase [Bacteriovoracaceae bacterium]|nr:adenylate kinase [Bacteriovoracaceae bacterium]
MKNLIFIGAPGSGKGTQSKKLMEDKGFKHVSTGDLLRAEISKKSKLGLEIKGVMDEGKLVSDELVIKLLQANVDLKKYKYIFDGYPRNIAQAKTLDSAVLDKSEYLAIYFKVDTEKLVERLTNRRVTADGKHIYNLLTNPPKVAGKCDVTGEALIQRDDDKEEVIRKRMKVYEESIGPVLDFYSKKGSLKQISAEKSVDKVYTEILKFLA